MRERGIRIHSLLSISRSTTPRTLIFKGDISEHYKLLLIMGKASLELYRVFEMSLSPANMANSWGPGSRNTQYYISQRAESTLTYLPPMSSSSLFAAYRLSPPYFKYSLYSSTCSMMTPRWRETRSSWVNCALRDEEAVYWVSIGHYKAVAVGTWWYWVSRGHLCLYILHKVEIWSGVPDA